MKSFAADIRPNSRIVGSDDLNDDLVPLVIGVTGHRDLVEAENPQIRQLVRSFFLDLQERFPDRPLQILSALAEGADRLVADVALELGVALIVPLPMVREDYLKDFHSEESRQHFDDLCHQSHRLYELPQAPGALQEKGNVRNLQYAQLGIFLCTHSHILLALWDGKPLENLGGTSQVVHFYHDDVMAGYEPSSTLNQQLLVDDESDLIYHIVVSRNRPNGMPSEGFKALSCSWFTTSKIEPRTEELPGAYVRNFERTCMFNRDVKKYWQKIEAECYPLIEEGNQALLSDEIKRIHRLFCAADWLAIFYQHRMRSALLWTHSLGFMMGMIFLLYSSLDAHRFYMMAFSLCFLVALLIHNLASRYDWHSKYLEYRTLAESLRIQFYWVVAGVSNDMVTKYSHDNYLQKQDSKLSWIPNVLRAIRIGCDVKPNLSKEGLEFVMNEWIGDDERGGQLKYFQANNKKYSNQSQRIDRMGKITGAVVTLLLLMTVIVPSEDVRNMLFVLVGALLLMFSVRQAYGYRISEKELIMQYQFMYGIFSNARRRIDAASNNSDRRQILRVLGESALDEHAGWVLRHRERPLDQSSLWRMES